MNRYQKMHGARRSRGFSLIEVMIAILVMGLGLLGFALLQTMSVRFTQSANHRTQATNLASDMLDQMRVNRLLAGQYAGNYSAATSGCTPDGTVTVDKYKVIWRCRLGTALGAGASAVVTYNNGLAQVSITWADQRWDADENQRNKTFQTETRL